MEKNIIIMSQKDLDNMIVKKYDDNDIPKIWVSNNTLYKKDVFNTMKRYKEYFELFNEYEELKNCVFPENRFYVNNKYFGYTTPYYEEYKSICFRMYKNKYSINEKKKITKKIVKLLSKMHDLNILHGDLHADNIICNKKDIKIIDFEKIRIKELEDETIYMWKLREDIYYLNLLVFTVLFDVNMSYVMESEYKEFIDNMSFSNEFKEYLNNCIRYKVDEIPKELLEYIDSLKRKDIVNGKELVRKLQL